MIRCKFRCTSVKQIRTCASDGRYGDYVEEVEFKAVSGEINKTWAKYTPQGELSFTINNSDAQNKLKPGQCYYLDLNEAPEQDS